MKRITFLGNLLAATFVLFFLYLAVTTPNMFDHVEPTLKTATALLAGIGIYTIGIGFGAIAWAVLLKPIEEQILVLTAIKIVFLSQAAKYIPGNVAHHIGRVVMAKHNGMGMNAILFSMFMETLWVISIASLLALIALWTVGSHVFMGIHQIPEWWTLGLLMVLSMLTPLIGHRLFEYAARWWALRTGINFKALKMPPLTTFWLVGFLYVLNYLILGVVMLIIATQVFGTHDGGILLLTGIFAVAWIVGFITPGAPAGLGVREVLLVAALTPIYGNETAIGITAVLRVVTVLGDGMAFIIGFLLGKISAKSVKYINRDANHI